MAIPLDTAKAAIGIDGDPEAKASVTEFPTSATATEPIPIFNPAPDGAPTTVPLVDPDPDPKLLADKAGEAFAASCSAADNGDPRWVCACGPCELDGNHVPLGTPCPGAPMILPIAAAPGTCI